MIKHRKAAGLIIILHEIVRHHEDDVNIVGLGLDGDIAAEDDKPQQLTSPLRQVMADVLTIYRLRDLGYERQDTPQFPPLKLGLTLWEGTFEGKHDIWLRWTDEYGVLIPTGKERADQERQRAEQEHQRAERLAALLLQAGIDPNQK